ncbi:MAG: acyl carrier protein [Luteolibacter sp.]|uniref:acyl carrier protein n=1 Tax=Luteolibacter sp. TaxID=1962973 RepID=UPI0032654C26
MDPTLENLVALICEHGVLGADEVLPESTFTSLGFDSLDHVDLILDCEEQFGIEFTDEESASALTVHDLYQLILSKQPA